MSGDKDDGVPRGVCTASGCKCQHFKPDQDRPMYCEKKKCQHSVEWHHLPAKEIEA